MKWLLRPVLAVTVALGGLLAVPQGAAAHPPAQPQNHPQTRYYHVYYRVSPDSPWVYYGYTPSYTDAVWYANWIRTTYGYETFVR